MKQKLEFKNFDLRNLKVTSKGLLEVEYYDVTKPQDEITINSDSKPHDDLVEVLSRFRLPFSESLHLLDGWNMARENTRKNDELLKEAVRRYNEEIARFNLSEVSITEKGVYLKGTMDCDDVKIKLSSPYIKFEDQESGIGSQSKEIVSELCTEVWRFLYADKRADDLFNQKEPKGGLGSSDGNLNVA